MLIELVLLRTGDQPLDTALSYGVIWSRGGVKSKTLLLEVVLKLSFGQWLKECVRFYG